MGNCEISATYDVPIRRFDQSFGAFIRPALSKIDVQGAELMVIEGMGQRIDDFDIFIVETSLIATLQGGAPEFADMALAMKKRGLALPDIIGITRRAPDRAMAQMDAVVVPEMSPLCFEQRGPILANKGGCTFALIGIHPLHWQTWLISALRPVSPGRSMGPP